MALLALLRQEIFADFFGLVTVSGMVLTTFGASEWLRIRAHWASERTRKVVHIGCGIVIFFMPYLFKSVDTIGLLAAVFVALLLSTKLLGFMQSIHAVRRRSVGVFFYPVAIYGSALLTWDRPALFQISVLLLAFADGLAALVGKRYGRHRYHLGAHVRTLEGSATVLGVSWPVTTALLALSGTTGWAEAAIIGALLAGVICAVEALSLWGIDNLLIPIVSAVFLRAAIHWPLDLLLWHLGACVVALAIATACQLKGYLKLNGAVAGWLVGYASLGFGGVAWFGALLAFFFSVNGVGKLAPHLFGADRALPADFERLEEKGSRRDFVQVFAKTGLCLVLPILYAAAVALGHETLARTLFWAYVGCLSAATADTFASVGILSRAEPVMIYSFAPVPRGLSGGVTMFGYGVAAFGAMVPLAAVVALGSPYRVSAMAWFGAIACGWIGSTVDSLAGAVFQEKRRCESCGKILEKPEHCGQPTRQIRGVPGVNNDLVNALGALAGAAAGAFILGGISS